MTALPSDFDSVHSAAAAWPAEARTTLVQRLLAALATELRADGNAMGDRLQELHDNLRDAQLMGPGAAASAAVRRDGPAERSTTLAIDKQFAPDTADLTTFWSKVQKEVLRSDRVSVWPCDPATPTSPATPNPKGGQSGLKSLEKLGQVIGMLAMMGNTDHVTAEGLHTPDAGPDETLAASPVVVQVSSVPIGANGRWDADGSRFAISCT
ncbi:MAG: hypothetical protein AB7S36_01510, partial [Planctomycetota bacterium]